MPEEVRSTVMNFFRIPLNLFVCIILYNGRAAQLDPYQIPPQSAWI